MKIKMKLIRGTGLHLPLPPTVKKQKVIAGTFEEAIINSLPVNYATVEVAGKPLTTKPLVGLIVPTFRRPEYVKKCLYSLSKTLPSYVVLCIVDESNAPGAILYRKQHNREKKFREQMDTNATEKIIREYNPSEFRVIKLFKKKHGNMFDSLRVMADSLKHHCTYLSNLDSDTIHSHGWMDKMINTYRLVQDTYKPLVVTGFNTDTHHIKLNTEAYAIKNTIGGISMLYEPSTYTEYIRPYLTDLYWDHAMCHNPKTVFVVTKPSVIQHIGEQGLWSFGDEHMDIAKDFSL